jgi:50S ribosomal protein L16 3-hydroxylase
MTYSTMHECKSYGIMEESAKKIDSRFYMLPRFGDLSFEQFMSTHWRRAPLYVRGGASALVSQNFDTDWFGRMRATLDEEAAVWGESCGDSVVFIEAINRAEQSLNAAAQNFANLFGVPSAWFDSVLTHTVSGIGSHFDHSDNFVLQQEGQKTWRLSPPESLPEGSIARRMLGDKSVGAAPIDQGSVIEYVLEPGDLLYMPLFWIHEGVSDGPSLSVSLVCPAVSLRTVFFRSLRAEIERRGLGWNPVPACPIHGGETSSRQFAEILARASAHLLKRLSDDDACRNMATDQVRYLRPAKIHTGGAT